MRKFIAALGVAASTLALASAPELAQARTHHGRYYHRTYYSRSNYRECKRSHANNGTIIGAVAGGLLGNAVAGRGSRTGGTLIGAGAGAVAGHQIAKHNANC